MAGGKYTNNLSSIRAVQQLIQPKSAIATLSMIVCCGNLECLLRVPGQFWRQMLIIS